MTATVGFMCPMIKAHERKTKRPVPPSLVRICWLCCAEKWPVPTNLAKASLLQWVVHSMVKMFTLSTEIYRRFMVNIDYSQ